MTVLPTMTATDALSPGEQETLLCVVDHMIPPSRTFDVPGAADPNIFADILRSLGRDAPALRQSLDEIARRAGGQLATLPHQEQSRLLAEFRADRPDLAGTVEAVTVRCYYRDDRVMRSLGMEARPPFPIGFDVQQGDWSLLDPVRARGKVYRDAD